MAASSVGEDKYRPFLRQDIEKNTKWRYGPPTYEVVNKLFEEGRTKVIIRVLFFFPVSVSLMLIKLYIHSLIKSLIMILMTGMGSGFTGRAGAGYSEAMGDGNVSQARFRGEPIGGSREIQFQPKR